MTGSIAYFIMVHHKPAQFEWLLRAIYTPDDVFLVHVDLKSRLGLKRSRRGLMREVRRICAPYPNVIIMRSRFTNWGGWSLSRTLLAAISHALRLSGNWSHFVNLSGQCYPLKPIEDVRREIVASGDQLHIELRTIADLPIDDWHRGANRMFETPLRAFRLPGRRPPPRGFDITHKGSQWVILPRNFCEWVTTARLTRSISAYMRRLLLTDELLMQTLALNGPFASNIAPSYRRAIIWPGPKVMTVDDLPYLAGSGAWFGRKFDEASDGEILALLAERHGFGSPAKSPDQAQKP